jgi:hypothetical protein
MIPSLEEVEVGIDLLLSEFPRAVITVDVKHCGCKICQTKLESATIEIALAGKRADGRELEAAFQHIIVFADEWNKWEARADLIRHWLRNEVDWELPAGFYKRLGPKVASHIVAVVLCVS